MHPCYNGAGPQGESAARSARCYHERSRETRGPRNAVRSPATREAAAREAAALRRRRIAAAAVAGTRTVLRLRQEDRRLRRGHGKAAARGDGRPLRQGAVRRTVRAGASAPSRARRGRRRARSSASTAPTCSSTCPAAGRRASCRCSNFRKGRRPSGPRWTSTSRASTTPTASFCCPARARPCRPTGRTWPSARSSRPESRRSTRAVWPWRSTAFAASCRSARSTCTASRTPPSSSTRSCSA